MPMALRSWETPCDALEKSGVIVDLEVGPRYQMTDT